MWKFLLVSAVLVTAHSAFAQPPASTPTPAIPEHKPGEVIVRLRSPDEPRVKGRPGDSRYKRFIKWAHRNKIDDLSIEPVRERGRDLQLARLSRTLKSNANRLQVSKEIRKLEKKGVRNPSSLNIYKVYLPAGLSVPIALEELRLMPNVMYAQPNFRYHTSQEGEKGFDEIWGVRKVQAEAAWHYTEGDGVVVAVVDTGVDVTHPDLASNMWINPGEIAGNCIDDDGNGFIDDVNGYDFTYATRNVVRCGTQEVGSGVRDGVGHGTHVAGTIAGAQNGQGVVGVAPKAKIMAVKGLSEDGSGSSESLTDALDYASRNGASVINNSWGQSVDSPSDPLLEDAIAAAASRGRILVFAAGNEGRQLRTNSLLALGNTINVGAIGRTDKIAEFSNFGSLIDVVAPGVGILSSFPLDLSDESYSETGFASWDGTSMAAPHVTGVVALMLASNHDLTGSAVRNILRDSADDLGPPGFDLVYGYGSVNAARAVERSRALAGKVNDMVRLQLLSPGKGAWYSFDQARTSNVSVRVKVEGPQGAKLSAAYMALDAKQPAWKPITTRLTPRANGEIGVLGLGNLTPGRYLLKVTATSETLQLSTTDQADFIVDEPGMIELGELSGSFGQVKAIGIDGTRVVWQQFLPNFDGEAHVAFRVMDVATGRFLDYPHKEESLPNGMLLSGNSIFFSEGAGVLDFGEEPNLGGLVRYDLGTKTQEMIDSCTTETDSPLQLCVKIGQLGPGGKLVWSKEVSRMVDTGGYFKSWQTYVLLKMYDPTTKKVSLLHTYAYPEEEIGRPRWIQDKIFLDVKTEKRENLLLLDPPTGETATTVIAGDSSGWLFRYFMTDMSYKEILIEDLPPTDTFPRRKVLMSYRGLGTSLRTVKEGTFFNTRAVAGPWIVFEDFDPARGTTSLGGDLFSTELRLLDRYSGHERRLTASGEDRLWMRASDKLVAWVEPSPRTNGYRVRAAMVGSPSPSPSPSPSGGS
jgi:subtilisin family serine protease